MSYFYLCLCVCQYLWIIKFLEWAYRKKWGIWGGIFIDSNYLFLFLYFVLSFISFLPFSSYQSISLVSFHFVYFYLCLCVCQYLWIIKFLEWAYRKKMGDMRGYFHRLGYWGFINRLILLRFSFVFIKTIGTCKFSNPKTWPNVKLENNYHIPDLVQAIPKKMVVFSCSVDWKLRWLSFLSVLSVFVDFPFWMLICE
jgi:hypothetical protein